MIKNFPMPPSVNSTLMPVMGKIRFNKKGKPYGQGRMIKTDKYLEYESRCIQWQLSHRTGLAAIKEEITEYKKDLESNKEFLSFKVQIFAVFPKEKILGKKNEVLSRDADNLAKPLLDNLFRALCIDDKYVFKTEIEKVIGDSEYAIVRISPYRTPPENEIKTLLGIKP